MLHKPTSFFLLLLLFSLTLLLEARPVRAQAAARSTITVDSVTDDGSGCTLREALEAANTNITVGGCAAGSGADTITFAVPANSVIPLNGTQLPSITDALTIDGSTADNLTISGNDGSRVFEIEDGAEVTVTHLTIVDGAAIYGAGIWNRGTLVLVQSTLASNESTGQGGGIFNQGGTLTVLDGWLDSNSSGSYGGAIDNSMGTVAVENSTLSGNSATYGGGITHDGGTMTVENSTLSGNTAASYGGGIYNDGGSTVTVANSTLSGNSANSGGGIYNDDGSTVTVANSTLSGNTAASYGGGILNGGGTLTVMDSTFSGNSADTSGGGIFSNGGTVTVANSTLSGNTAASYGGGIYNWLDSTMIVTNSILANSLSGEDCWNDGIIDAFVANIVESGNCGSAITADPLLSPLQDNGGATLTHALLPGSPAIDVGDSDACLATDQRGVARPQLGSCDIGAFESQGFTLTITSGDEQTAPLERPFAQPLAVQVSSESGEPVGPGGIVTFSAPTSGASIGGTNPFTATTNASGTVSPIVTANSTTGAYEVTVETAGADVLATFTLTNSNTPPVVMSADQQVRPGDTVQLDGSGSYDADGHEPLSYAWEQTGGPAVDLSDSAVVSPTFVAPDTPVVLTFDLTVTDSYGASSTDAVVVEVGSYLYLPLLQVAGGTVGVRDDGAP